MDFAALLSIWLFEFHLPEADFWRTMNVCRLNLLLAKRYKPAAPAETQKPQSLSAFFSGRG